MEYDLAFDQLHSPKSATDRYFNNVIFGQILLCSKKSLINIQELMQI